MPPPVLRRIRLRPPIIAALLVVLLAMSGCGMALKLGYEQGGPIAFRWLDGYVDFNDAQSLRVRAALDEWFAWHRRSQLADYADLLARAETEVLADTTPERMCAWAAEIRGRVDAAFEHALPALVDVLPTLSPQQLANIEKKYGERNESYRDDYLQRSQAKRRAAAVEREVERAEKLYGPLDDAERDGIARRLVDSPFDAELSYGERLRRQQDLLATVRRMASAAGTRADAEIRGYVERLDRSPNDVYRRYAAALRSYNCGLAAAIHNLTSAAQRSVAGARLKGYERELRSLAAAAAPAK